MSTTPATPPAPFEEALLARIEDAGINASAPREQRWSTAGCCACRRERPSARCIQAVAPGRLDIDAAGYLQVDAANEAARRIYRRLGFADGYSYHYRTPRDDAA